MMRFVTQWLGASWQGVCAFLLVAAIVLLAPAAIAAQAPVGKAETPTSDTPKADTKSDESKTDTEKSSDPLAQQYPTPQPPKAKLEGTVGALKVRFYGTLLLNIATSDTAVFGQDIPLWSFPDSVPFTFPDGTARRAGDIRDTIFTARQTVLGFTLSPTSPAANGWVPSGVLEFDFFGVRPVDAAAQPQGRVFNSPRLRLAYLQLERGSWKIVAGQDRVILAPLDPVSLSHVAAPLGATAGNLWMWLPQVRLDLTREFGERKALFQVGVLRPQFGDPRLAAFEAPTPGSAVDVASSGLGERATHPFYQARVAVSAPFRGQTSTVGLAGHYGRERVGATRTLDSWALAVDWNVPFQERLILRGEAFVGSNLIPFQGGVLQGVSAVLPGQIRRIGAGGGWVELTVLATTDNKNILYVGAGTDDPRDRHLLPGTGRAKNSFVWISYFRKLTEEVTFAFEWSNWQFRTEAFVGGLPGPRGPFGSANVFNLSLAYQF